VLNSAAVKLKDKGRVSLYASSLMGRDFFILGRRCKSESENTQRVWLLYGKT